MFVAHKQLCVFDPPGHSRQALSLDAARAASSEGTGQGKVDVLLTVNPHHEAGDVHHLLAHPV